CFMWARVLPSHTPPTHCRPPAIAHRCAHESHTHTPATRGTMAPLRKPARCTTSRMTNDAMTSACRHVDLSEYFPNNAPPHAVPTHQLCTSAAAGPRRRPGLHGGVNGMGDLSALKKL